MFLNGVEIWRIGRQKDEFVSAFLKDPPGFLSFVKGGIVHDDQGAGLKLLQELFLEVLVKNGGVQAPLKKEWGEEPFSLGGGRDEVGSRSASPAALPQDLAALGGPMRKGGGRRARTRSHQDRPRGRGAASSFVSGLTST